MAGVLLITFAEYLNYFVVYKNVFGISLTKKKLPYVLVTVLACVIQGISYYYTGDKWRDNIILSLGFVIMPILAERQKKKTAVLFLIVVLLVSLINIIGSYGLAALIGITQKELCDSVGLTLLAEIPSFVVFTIYGKIKKNSLAEDMSFGWLNSGMMILGGICCFLVLAFAQGAWDDNALIFVMKKELLIASVIVTCFFFIIVIRYQIVEKKVIDYQIANEKYRLHLQSQQEHIQMLLDDDERRRRLKHDLHAHILALNTYVQQGELESIREYLSKMEESISTEQTKRYIGILGVDAIIHEGYNKAMQQNVCWSFEGSLNKRQSITNFELCVIFSNLLTNALEAIQKVNGERCMAVNVSNVNEKMVIIVKNTCMENLKGNAKPKSSKQDKLNHGLGLKNVEDIVNKHGGSIQYKAQNGWFEAMVIL